MSGDRVERERDYFIANALKRGLSPQQAEDQWAQAMIGGDGQLAPGKRTLLDDPYGNRGRGARRKPASPGKVPRTDSLPPQIGAQSQLGAQQRVGLEPPNWKDGLDPTRASETGALVRTLMDQLGIATAPEIHVDKLGAQRTAAAGTAGVMESGNVYLDPASFDPNARASRRLLAHEFTHVAQWQQRGSDAKDGGASAEAEAAFVGSAFVGSGAANGGKIGRPRASLATSVARDEGKQAPVANVLRTPPALQFAVRLPGLVFTPVDKNAMYAPGVDKTLQFAAGAVKALVKSGYTSQLALDALAHVRAQPRGLQASSGIRGKAVQSETINLTRVAPTVALEFIAFLKTRKLPLAVNPAQVIVLERLVGINDSYSWVVNHAKPPLPRWYDQNLYRFRMVERGKLLNAFGAAFAAYQANENEETRKAVVTQAMIIGAVLRPNALVIDAIRRDAALTGEPMYRAMFLLPAAPSSSQGSKLAIVSEDTRVDAVIVRPVMQQCVTGLAIAARARQSGPSGHKARKSLLSGASSAIAARAGEAPQGDIAIRDAPSRANAPAVPSSMAAYPALQPPLFDKASGADHKFAMWMTFPTTLEAVAVSFINHFYWEVIHVPQDQFKNIAKTAKDNDPDEMYRPSWGGVMSQRVGRQADYFSEDMAEVRDTIGGIESILGPAGAGAAGLVAVSRGLGALGAVVSTFVEAITASRNEKTIPFKGVCRTNCVSEI